VTLIIKQPNPGDKKNDFINRRLIKEVTKSTREQSPTPPPESPDYSYVLGQIPAGSSYTYLEKYDPVMLDGTYYWTPDTGDASLAHLNSRVVKCYSIAESTPKLRQWGIALDCITDTAAGRILLTGVCWLATPDSIYSANATHINVIENLLVPGYNGRASILQRMSKPHTLVHLTERITPLRGKTKSGGLTAGTEGMVYYSRPTASPAWTVTTKEIPAWCDQGNIAGDKEIILFPIEGRWYAMELCPGT